ncbi:MAG TPA: TadE/TadG family type IV pilus assembly protein [Candidatus Limnocylindrales bacterium]|jgi:Flp pilus assembly protein TadG
MRARDRRGQRGSHGKHGHRGQALVEFSLVFPLLVLFAVAMIDMGRAVWAYTQITNAARQGARVAAVNQVSSSSECDASRPIEDPLDAHWTIVGCAIVAGGPLGLTASNVSVSYAAPPSTTVSCSPTLHIGCIASVTVTYAYTPATPILSAILSPIGMSATSQQPIERVFP